MNYCPISCEIPFIIGLFITGIISFWIGYSINRPNQKGEDKDVKNNK